MWNTCAPAADEVAVAVQMSAPPIGSFLALLILFQTALSLRGGDAMRALPGLSGPMAGRLLRSSPLSDAMPFSVMAWAPWAAYSLLLFEQDRIGESG
jgi:hypothetical protein